VDVRLTTATIKRQRYDNNEATMIDGNTTTNDDDTKDDYSIFDNPPVIKMTPAGNDSDSPVPQRTSAIGHSKEEMISTKRR
jgi:hypothetical protein